jgi:hypothetical protein
MRNRKTGLKITRGTTALWLALLAGCSSSSVGANGPPGGGTGDSGASEGGAEGGGRGGATLLSNPGVTQTCQTCLSGATGNDCSAQAKTCGNDPNCVALNACVNKCTDLNAGCIQNCEDAAAVNSVDEWSSWFTCACNDCSTQCSECAAGTGTGTGSGTGTGTGSGTGTGTVTCQLDNSGQYFVCQGNENGYYCTGTDTPAADGLSPSCGSGSADPSGTGLDYCCQ